MIRVAVVGTGSAGRRHLANLARAGCRELVAVSEHSRVGELAVEGVGAVRVMHDYEAALEEADAVVIANPSSLHHTYVQTAIDHGRHVLCEKPLGVSAAEIADLPARADAAGVVAGVGCQFRFEPHLERLRGRLREGALGRVLDVEATQGEHLADYHPDEDYRISYAARSELGGGILLTQIHQIDLLAWLFGPFVRVAAVGGHRTDLDLDVEDSVTYLLETADGVAVRGHLDFIQRPRRMELTVTGTEGRASWDYYGSRLDTLPARAGAEPVIETSAFDRDLMFRRLIDDFLASIHEGRRPRTSLHDGVAAVAVVDAVKRAMKTGRTEVLEGGPSAADRQP